MSPTGVDSSTRLSSSNRVSDFSVTLTASSRRRANGVTNCIIRYCAYGVSAHISRICTKPQHATSGLSRVFGL